jgi:hypothetical protein
VVERAGDAEHGEPAARHGRAERARRQERGFHLRHLPVRRGRDALERVVEARGDPGRAAAPERRHHLTDVAAVRIHRRGHAPIDRGRARAHPRVDQHERQGHAHDGLDALAASGPEHGAATEEERHVRAERHGELVEPGHRPAEPPETAQAHERRGGVRRAAAEPGRHRDPLVEPDSGPPAHRRRFPQRVRRPRDQIASIARNVGRAGAHFQDLGVLDHQPVGEVHSLHDRGDFVITVVPLAQNLQSQIDLGRGAEHEPTGDPRPLRQGTEA